MSGLTFAHFSDPHLGPLPHVRMRQLASKRLTGYYNYRRSRVAIHDMKVLAAIVADMRGQNPSHIVCTGDVANIGLMAEFEAAAAFLSDIGSPETLSFVPGNHDVYVRGSLTPLIHHLGPWMAGDDGAGTRFPYVKQIGPVALVGLSSAVPTLPFIASGTLGRRQLAAADACLRLLGAQKLCRIVLIHHPPHRGGARPGRGLTDADAFESMLRVAGAELVLHGHNHVGSLAFRPGPGAQVPILGVPSASANGGASGHHAAYHLIHVEPDGRGFRLSAQARELKADGTIGPSRTFVLNEQTIAP